MKLKRFPATPMFHLESERRKHETEKACSMLLQFHCAFLSIRECLRHLGYNAVKWVKQNLLSG